MNRQLLPGNRIQTNNVVAGRGGLARGLDGPFARQHASLEPVGDRPLGLFAAARLGFWPAVGFAALAWG